MIERQYTLHSYFMHSASLYLDLAEKSAKAGRTDRARKSLAIADQQLARAAAISTIPK